MTKSRSSWLSFLSFTALIALGMTACEIIEALELFPEVTQLQRQAGVFLPLILIWTRLEHLTE